MPTKERRAKLLGIAVEDLPDNRGKHGNSPKGSSHHKWSNTIIDKQGYKKVRVGKGHPLADPNGYAYEHWLIYRSAGGNTGPNVLHHKNGDRLDNRLENLELMSRADHNRLHNKNNQRDSKTGRFIGKKKAGNLLDGVKHEEWPE